MKLFLGNVTGVNGPSKHKIIRKKIHHDKVSVILNQETKCTSGTLEALMSHLWKGTHVVALDA